MKFYKLAPYLVILVWSISPSLKICMIKIGVVYCVVIPIEFEEGHRVLCARKYGVDGSWSSVYPSLVKNFYLMRSFLELIGSLLVLLGHLKNIMGELRAGTESTAVCARVNSLNKINSRLDSMSTLFITFSLLH